MVASLLRLQIRSRRAPRNGRCCIHEERHFPPETAPFRSFRLSRWTSFLGLGTEAVGAPSLWRLSARHLIDVAGDDAIRLRRATIADAEPLARGVIEGVEDYPSFAPPGWAAPSFEAELEHLREVLPDPDVCCLIAESEGALIGQITILPAARSGRPVEDSSLAHISNLVVRRDYWGVGLAGDLHRAALQAASAAGFKELRLFVAAGQARARRFYEREGWVPINDPFDDPTWGLTFMEYRYRLPAR